MSDAMFRRMQAEQIQRLQNELKKYQWISVKDRLPETSGRYLVHVKNIAGYKPLKNCEFIAEYFWVDWIFTGWENNRVTHWMPLPEPPKE